MVQRPRLSGEQETSGPQRLITPQQGPEHGVDALPLISRFIMQNQCGEGHASTPVAERFFFPVSLPLRKQSDEKQMITATG